MLVFQLTSYLDCTENGMGLAGNSDDDGALLHGLGSIFNLEYSALGRAIERKLA
jgi:hypothetical protein